MHVKDNTETALWMARFQSWCTNYEAFLKERNDNMRMNASARRGARSQSSAMQGHCLPTWKKKSLQGMPVPSTSNKIENLNGRIRRMLSLYCSMNIKHRIKAVFWFCYIESESPISTARMLKIFPTDDVRRWRFEAARQKGTTAVNQIDEGGLALSEFRHSTPYPYRID